MSENITLIVALAVPVLIITLLRMSGALLFMALCMGYVLEQFVGNDASTMLGFLSPKVGQMSTSTLHLSLLLLPVILAGILTVFSVKGKIRSLLNILPALGVAGFGLLVAVPLCTPGVQGALQTQALWNQLTQLQTTIIGLGAIVSLSLFWTQHRGGERRRKR